MFCPAGYTEISKRVSRLADLLRFRKGVALMMSYVTFSELFAFALVIVGVIALCKNKGR
jgi:hypothetical protein